MAAVSPFTVADLCQGMLATNVVGAWAALDVAYMFVHSDDAKWSALATTLKSIISTCGMLRELEPEWRVNTHAFAQVAENLVEHDQELAKILMKEIIDATALTKHIAGIDHCLEKVLKALLETQLATVWPLLTTALEGTDGLTRWELGDLLQNRFGEVGEIGLLGKVPFAYLARWCAHSPDIAPMVLARIVQAMEKKGDDSWALSEIATYLVDNHGKNPSVLSALSANINSFSWSGSLVPFYERQVATLMPLKGHPIAEVQRWAERLIESATQQAQQESERDEEHVIGRY